MKFGDKKFGLFVGLFLLGVLIVGLNFVSADSCGTFSLEKPISTIASSEYTAGYAIAKAFDDNIKTRWASKTVGDEWESVTLDFGEDKCIGDVDVNFYAGSANMPLEIRLEFSKDNQSWTELDENEFENYVELKDALKGDLKIFSGEDSARYIRISLKNEKYVNRLVSINEIKVMTAEKISDNNIGNTNDDSDSDLEQNETGYDDNQDVAKCFDSDKGLNYYVRGGTVNGIENIINGSWIVKGTFVDECNGNTLKEFYCNEEGEVLTEEYSCSNGCSNGLCLKKNEDANNQNTVCSELIDFVANPKDYNFDGVNYTVIGNYSRSDKTWINDVLESYNFSSSGWQYYDKSNSDGTDGIYSNLRYGVYVFDNKNISLENELNRLSKLPVCKINSYYENSYGKESFVYLCNYGVFNEERQLEDDWSYSDKVIYWFNDNVLVEMEFYSGKYISDSEFEIAAQRYMIDLLNSAKNNRYKSIDYNEFDLPWNSIRVISDSISKCNSDLEPLKNPQGESCSPSWVCKTEPSICPEYGYQTRTCIDYSDCKLEKREEQIYCSPGICSGCYIPRWLGSEDNLCVPYGSRFEKQISLGNGIIEDTNEVTLKVSENYYSSDEVITLTVNSNNTASLYVSSWNDKTYTFSNGEEFRVNLSKFDDSRNTLEISVTASDINYNLENYNESSVKLFIVVTREGEKIEKINAYCDIDGNVKQQKEKLGDGSWAACQNNYECASNLCSGGECIEINDAIKQGGELKGLLIKALCRMSNLFDKEGYNQCLIEYIK